MPGSSPGMTQKVKEQCWTGLDPPYNTIIAVASIPARAVDDVEQRLAGAQAADVVGDLRGGRAGDRDAREVRRDHDLLEIPERMTGRQRLGAEDIEHGPADLALADGGGERRLVD